MSVRDSQRSRVYAAEGFVRTMFDRAAEHHNRVIDFFGTSLTLPPEARFGAVGAVQRYVDEVLAMPAVTQRWPETGALSVRPRRGTKFAHYDPSEAVIAVSEHPEAGSLRELVVLHEIAHHLSPAAPAHGSEFVSTMCELAALVMGPEVGHVLRVVYAKEGVG